MTGPPTAASWAIGNVSTWVAQPPHARAMPVRNSHVPPIPLARLSLATEDRGDRFGLNVFRARHLGVCGRVRVDRARRGAEQRRANRRGTSSVPV